MRWNPWSIGPGQALSPEHKAGQARFSDLKIIIYMGSKWKITNITAFERDRSGRVLSFRLPLSARNRSRVRLYANAEFQPLFSFRPRLRPAPSGGNVLRSMPFHIFQGMCDRGRHAGPPE